MNFEKIVNFIDSKYHHKRIIKFIKNYKISILIDIGSHKGEFLENFLKFKKVKTIYAFEPQIDVYNTLNKKFKKYKNIKKINIALDSKVGKKKLHINKLSLTSTLSITNNKSFFLKIKKLLLQNDKSFIKSYFVKTSTIDVFFKNINLKDSLLKIDVEGFEYNVLLGSKKSLQKIGYIIIEKQFSDLHKGYNFNSSHNFLLKNKFKLVKKFKFPLMNFEDRLYLNTSFKKNDTFNND
jgi:FkbM family methyltransferase